MTRTHRRGGRDDVRIDGVPWRRWVRLAIEAILFGALAALAASAAGGESACSG
jgi:hypothetical protein